MARNKIMTTVYVEPDQDAALKRIRERTGIPTAVLLREAIDILITRSQDDRETAVGRAEAVVDERRAQAERERRDPDVLVLELDDLTTHARQLMLELREARQLAAHYRLQLTAARDALDKALLTPPDLRMGHASSESEDG